MKDANIGGRRVYQVNIVENPSQHVFCFKDFIDDFTIYVPTRADFQKGLVDCGNTGKLMDDFTAAFAREYELYTHVSMRRDLVIQFLAKNNFKLPS